MSSNGGLKAWQAILGFFRDRIHFETTNGESYARSCDQTIVVEAHAMTRMDNNCFIEPLCFSKNFSIKVGHPNMILQYLRAHTTYKKLECSHQVVIKSL